MTITSDILFSLIFALLLSVALGWGFQWRHPARADDPGVSLLFLFLILTLVMWASAAWLPAWGPRWYGSAWITIVCAGVVASLLLLTVVAPRSSRPPRSAGVLDARVEDPDAVEAPGPVFTVFFWILIAVLLTAALAPRLMLA